MDMVSHLMIIYHRVRGVELNINLVLVVMVLVVDKLYTIPVMKDPHGLLKAPPMPITKVQLHGTQVYGREQEDKMLMEIGMNLSQEMLETWKFGILSYK